MTAAKDSAEEIHRSIERQEDMVADIADMGEPTEILHDRVEFVPMNHKETLATRRRMDATRLNAHIGVDTGKVRDALIMVARDVDDPSATATLAQDFLDDVAVLLRPVETTLHRPEIDEITDHIERLTLEGSEKSEKSHRLTSSCPKVNVRDPDTAISSGLLIHFYPLYGTHIITPRACVSQFRHSTTTTIPSLKKKTPSGFPEGAVYQTN